MGIDKGYSLLELIVIMAIVGILAAIAFPTYHSHVIVANRSDAHIDIQDLAARQERWMAQFNHYTDDVTDLTGSSSSTKGHYTLKIVYKQLTNGANCKTAASPSSPNRRQYTIIALPLSASQKTDSDCTCIFMTNVGFRGSSGARTDASDCW